MDLARQMCQAADHRRESATAAGYGLSRRGFLCRGAMTAGLVTFSRLHFPTPTVAQPTADAGLRVFSAHEAEVLTAIVERMVNNEAADMPAVAATRTIATIDQAVLQLESSLRSQLRWLLVIFQWGPPVFLGKLRTFTGLSPDERDEYIRDWAASRFATRRLAFRALKNLSMLGYYSQDETWAGIHYDGPWAPRPRRIIGDQGKS